MGIANENACRQENKISVIRLSLDRSGRQSNTSQSGQRRLKGNIKEKIDLVYDVQTVSWYTENQCNGLLLLKITMTHECRNLKPKEVAWFTLE